jgi:Ca2+-binding EF-hand superfamily protein
MYKHANAAYARKRNFSVSQAQHAVSIARIRTNMRRIGAMVKVIEPPAHEVALPAVKVHGEAMTAAKSDSTTRFEALASPVNSRRDRLLQELKSPNTAKISAVMAKVHEAETTGISKYEVELMAKLTKGSRRANRTLQRSASVVTSVVLFEKKLAAAIRVVFSDPTNQPENKIVLTTRVLLPYYKLSDVKHFLEIYRKVDEDYSGDLDPEEWCNFFTAMSQSVTRVQARAIFNRVDVNGQGFLSFRELIPVIFNNATKDVQKLILKYVESEMSKWKAYGKNILTEADLIMLFEYYDEHDLGFILVDTLRERIKALNLPQQVCFAILEVLKDMDADEMINSYEFVRIFRPYVVE